MKGDEVRASVPDSRPDVLAAVLLSACVPRGRWRGSEISGSSTSASLMTTIASHSVPYAHSDILRMRAAGLAGRIELAMRSCSVGVLSRHKHRRSEMQ